MFRSKKDVDRHVQNVFCKLRNENEKNLRCYNVAKLYYQVGDYESTKRYVFNYLEIRDNSASAHKLLGQAYEALGQKEAAFNEYKVSLELEGRQNDLVLKICELLVDMDIGMDVNKLKYWIERADKLFPHNRVVFQLKEKLLTIEKPSNSSEDLEALIASELAARPTDVQLRIKLLNYYMSEGKLDKAYEHAISVEATVPHRDSITWYQLLYELLTKYKETKPLDWSFWFYYISVSDKYAGLCLKEQSGETKKSIPEAAQAVFNFDQNLNEMKSKKFSKQRGFTEHLFTHMWGQLHFHLACLLLRKTKREQGSWNEAGRLCSPLLLTALHVAPLEGRMRIQLEDDGCKNQFNVWAMEAAYRCSQAGYILQNYARDDTKKLMDRIDKFCTGLWRERIYQRIFVTRIHLDHMRNSFFCHFNSVPDPPLRMCTGNQLKTYSQLAQEVWPASLHHQIWLGMENRPQNKDAPHPDQTSRVFPALQFSIFNTNQAAPDSLCLIDIDAFLNAAILCSIAVLEEQQLSSFMNPEKLPTLPVDLTTTLSTSNQEKWWSAAYKMYSKREDVDGDIGELRQELQQGLEVIRCIGNHGMHPVLLVHLARMFHYRAKMMKEKDEANGYIPRWEARSELYWTAALPLLERLQNNQTLRMSTSKLFNYQGKEINNFELTNALEEGKLLLAQRLVRDKQYEQAMDALQALKCPEASFQLAQIYKIFADEIVNSTPRESLTSEMRSQHIIMLSKARNSFYLTLDRLRSPGTNPKHPLNSELGTHITDIENELKRIDPDLGRGELSRNDIDGISDESYSPTHSAVDQAVTNPTLPMLTTLTGASNILSTPQRNIHRTPKHASTPCRLQDYLNLSKNRTEARPSPERLDAQIRQIMQSRDNEIQELMEQMKNMMTQMKTLTDKVDDLTKEVVESRKENQKQQQQQQRIQQQQNVNPVPVDPEDFYVLDDDEYVDLNYQNQPTGPASSISSNIYTPQHARHPYSSLMYPPAATAFQYYQGGLPFTDPNAQAAISSLYPHTVYPMPMLYPNQTKVPDNPLQQGLFASTLSSQLPDLMPTAATNPSLQISLKPKIETPSRTKPEAAMATTTTTTTTIIKDAPVNKAPPVNVVITTSDTLPTTVPPTQPTLSVTIPPQYRLGGGATVTFSTTPITTVMMPVTSTMTTAKSSSSNVPHCYQIPMPLQATIPTTVNLPPTSTYVTPTNINLPIYAITTSSSIVTMTHTTSNDTSLSSQDNASKIHDKTDTTKSIYEPVESPNTSTEICEQEHDPIPNFIPVIPLPAKVKVTTGEENEDTLYCGRAKLFRFVDKEWKERGVGDVKLLRNEEGKVRLLMRRDQILKICANHMLRPDMELSPMTNNNKAWFWVANDFADEEVKLEKLCIRFKTAEEAMAFKEAFDQARLSLSAISPAKAKISEKVSTTCSDKDSSKTQRSQSTQQTKISSTTEVVSDKSKSGTTTLGGFSFSSKPIIQEVNDTETGNSKKIEESPKVSPFSGFSFTKSTNKAETKITTITATSSSASPTSPGFVFSTSTTNSQSCVLTSTVSTTSPIFSSPTTTGQGTTLRRPRLPPPGAKQGLSIGYNDETRPQTENEQRLFVGTVYLQCQSTDTIQWKNEGTGSMMLLLNIKSGKLRLLFTNDESSKIYGHGVPLDMAFTYKSGTTVVTWIVPGDGKEVGKTWPLHAVIFNTPELALLFYNIVSSCQQKLAKGNNPTEIAKEVEKKIQMSLCENKDQIARETKPPLSELFKPPTGSWECSACYTRNKATDTICIACEAPSPLAASNKSSSVASKLADSSKPLSELFKKPAGSWTCAGCYIVNSETNAYCVACDNPKDPSQPPKPQQASIFQLSASSSGTTPMTTFSFGIPKDTSKEMTGFSFRMPKAEDKSTNDSAKVTSSKFETTSTNFMFGMPTKNSSTLNTSDSPFTFGSPAKSFGFNFTKSPVKSPGGETSEDEVVESEDVHFSPIVPLPEKIEVKTGEEDEEILYSHRAKLFRFDTAAKEWKERGLGDIKLLCHKETGKLRLIMRRDHVLKLCLNHIVSNELEFTSKDEKTWLWTTADYSEGEIEYMQFACRFKTAEIAADFKKAIDDARKNIKPSTVNSSNSSSTKIGKLTTKTPTKTTTSPTKEIEIVYEVTVTPEEKAAALKLQLPENFYAYKQKENCPGCRGCRKPSIVLYPDTAGQDSTKGKSAPEEKKPITQSKVISNVPESTSDITQAVTQSASVKNGFSFATSTASFKSPDTSTNFDSSTMSFGTSDLKLFNDKKTTTFSFGMNPQFGTNEVAEKTTATTTMNASLENLKVCSPSNVQTTQTSVFNTSTAGQPIFGQTTSTASIFKTPTFTFDSDKSIFGGSTSKTSSKMTFSENNGDSSISSTVTKTTTAVTTANSVPKTSTVTTSTITSSNSVFGASSTPFSKITFGSNNALPFGSSANIFGGTTAATTMSLFGGTTAVTTTNIFGKAMTPTTNIFGGSMAPSTTNIFSGTTTATATNVFGTPTMTNVFGATSTVFDTKLPDNTQKNEDGPSFFSGNNMFSALAAAAAQPEAFKVDPNFSFAGAGSSVFGSKSATSLNSSKVLNKSHEDSVQKEDNEDDGEVDNEQEHDPHFEPIIPLPDAIEVRTGEEDEEKVFSHRAKLYRYDNGTKEWKERGVGEMKILHHAGHGSYRLLLRREQVHKVVCNFLVTSDVEFHPLSTSDQAWMWAGMNYAEQEPCVEQLAVKFKSPDLARQFKAHIDDIQQELREKRTAEGESYIGEVEDSEEQGNDVDEEQEEDDEEEEEEDDQEMFPIIEKRATVFARWPNDNKWETVGLGNLAIHYDSEIYAERIVLKLDDSEEYASNTIISMDTVMRVEGKECIWSGIDYALDPPMRRILRAVFSSVQAAQQMHTFFEDGVDSAKQAGVVEYQEAE